MLNGEFVDHPAISFLFRPLQEFFRNRLVGERTSASLQEAKERGQRLGQPLSLSKSVVKCICDRAREGGLGFVRK